MPRRWLMLSVRSPSDELSPLLAEGLVALGGNAVLEDSGTLTTWVAASTAGADAVLARAREQLSAIAGAPLDVTAEWHDDEDWTERWRRGLAPRRVGTRIVVTPSWCEPETAPGDVVLVIDPAMAFGTGEHASTRGALRLLERALRPGDVVLDAGTGSGILAIAAMLLGAQRADAVDSDVEALVCATENAERHHVLERIAFQHAEVDLKWLAARAGRYDIATANILSGILEPLLPGFRAALRHEGRLILGGILREEADDMIAAARDVGFALLEEDREDEWWTGLFARQPS